MLSDTLSDYNINNKDSLMRLVVLVILIYLALFAWNLFRENSRHLHSTNPCSDCLVPTVSSLAQVTA